MYVWKCWRETRFLFIVFLAFFASMTCLITIASALVNDPIEGWKLLRGGDAVRVAHIWKSVLNGGVMGWGAFFAVLAGVGLGGRLIGDEISRGTIEFLFTRPRKRSHFAWLSWATGIVEVGALSLVVVVIAFVFLVYCTRTVYDWRTLVLVIPLFVFGIVVFSLTMFFSVVTRSAGTGVSVSLLCVACISAVPYLVRSNLQIEVPSLLDLLACTRWITEAGYPFPIFVVAGWAVLALVIHFTALLVLERYEL